MDYKKLSDDLAKLLDARGMNSLEELYVSIFVCLLGSLFLACCLLGLCLPVRLLVCLFVCLVFELIILISLIDCLLYFFFQLCLSVFNIGGRSV